MNKLSNNILCWCNNPEDEAIEQAVNISKHPWLVGNVCLMPDTHCGYGMPIGGVVALDKAVCPNMVGVDIGCTDGDTEFLSPKGWVKIKDYNNEDILIYNPTNDTSFFQKPIAYINKPTDKFYVLKNQVVDQVLTAEHKVILFSSRTNKPYVQLLDYLIDKNKKLKKGINHRFRNYIPNYKANNSNTLSDNDIRLILAISADGRIRNNSIEFHLKKERKIKRLRELCNSLNITINEHNKSDGTYSCTINYSKALKDLTPLYTLNAQQLSIVVDEVVRWDGHVAKDGQRYYYSTIKSNIDFVQFAFAVCGIRCTYSIQKEKDNWSTYYSLYTTNNNHTYFPQVDQISTIQCDGLNAYCFTTSTGYWFMRRNGKIVITGNCGMLAVKTTLVDEGYTTEETLNQLKSILGGSKEFKGGIRGRIPVGFSHHSKAQDHYIFNREEWESSIICKEELESAHKQIGTLGGGNHFIEIQRGDDNRIWFMIHSGSRNLGYRVAKYYNEIANGLCTKWKQHEIVKNGLAVLPVDTEEGQNYLKEMNLCMDFAYANRQLMADVIREEFSRVFNGDIGFPVEINIHHNYASLEHHYGRNVWVHRKGATLARTDTVGIIPGSQGTASYIVQGLGNPASLCSCSHGAGRKMSRKKAQENLNLEEEQRKMDEKGILHAIRGKSDLDEAAGAYKDIDVVMEEQKDLVKTIVKLTPLAVVKG